MYNKNDENWSCVYFLLSPQSGVRTSKSASAPQETLLWWNFCIPVLTPNLRATSWVTAEACSTSSLSSCLTMDNLMRLSLVRSVTYVYFQSQAAIYNHLLVDWLVDAEPKYLIAVQPIPANEVKKTCTGIFVKMFCTMLMRQKSFFGFGHLSI